MAATSDMRTKTVLGLGLNGFHRISYTEWGPEQADRTLLCVHGLTRNGRDFDVLAEALSDAYRVVCPDVVGRGLSDRLVDADHYDYLQYNADMNALIARLGVDEIDWLGTSMGGVIGMMLAALPGSPIRRLVINDIGPTIPGAALDRLATYVGKAPDFADLDAVEAYLRQIHAPFAPMSDEDWRRLAEHSARPRAEGGFELSYDQRIGDKLRQSAPFQDVDLWMVWDRVQCPVLVLRGAHSDLLTAKTAQQMTTRGTKARLVEMPDAGHTPSLNSAEEIALVRDWLSSTDA